MPERKNITEDELTNLFEKEFGFIKGKFSVHNKRLQEIREDSSTDINGPGIYVHWRDDLGAIKVSKSQSNSKKRALEHIRDNTKNDKFEMKLLENDQSTRLILFNIVDPNEMHWLLSLEAYLDKNCDPLIPSGRIG